MTTLYTPEGGISPAPSVIYAPTPAERAAWALFDTYKASGKALWLDAGGRYALGSGPADPPAGFELADRCARRLFRPEPVRNRHPVLTTVSGKGMFLFGGGGSGPNNLDVNFNGTLYPPPILAADGTTEINQTPMLLPGTGWTIAFCAALAVPGGTLGGVTYATSGGYFLGGGVVAADNGQGPALAVGFDSSNGSLRAFNQIGVTATNQYLQVGVDHRTGSTYRYVLTWDVASGTMRAWRDRALVATQNNCTTDIATATGCSLPMIGGVGQITTGPAARFFGGLSFLGFLPSAVGNDDAARSTLFDLLATR